MLIKYSLTNEALDAEFIATGIRGQQNRTLKIDETLLTSEQRTVLVKYLSPFSVSLVRYEVEPFRVFSFSFSKPRIVERGVDLPAEPSVEEVIEHLKRMSAEKQEAESLLQMEMQLYTTAIEEKAKKRVIEQAEEEAKKEAEAQRKAEQRLARMIIPWNDQGKAIVNLYEVIFAATNFERDGREGFAAWVKEVEHIDPTQPNGYSIVGSWVNDRTVEIERGQRHVYLVANQTGSRKNRTTEYTVIAMDDDGVLHTTGIFTDDTDKGWALRIRDQIAALL